MIQGGKKSDETRGDASRFRFPRQQKGFLRLITSFLHSIPLSVYIDTLRDSQNLHEYFPATFLRPSPSALVAHPRSARVLAKPIRFLRSIISLPICITIPDFPGDSVRTRSLPNVKNAATYGLFGNREYSN